MEELDSKATETNINMSVYDKGYNIPQLLLAYAITPPGTPVQWRYTSSIFQGGKEKQN